MDNLNLNESEIEMLNESGIPIDEPDNAVPLYRKMNNGIVVSKHHGKLWKERKQIAAKHLKDKKLNDVRKQALAYYNNSQTKHSGSDGTITNNLNTSLVSEELQTVENIVFSNIQSLVPFLYAKNPTVEVTSLSDDPEDQARTRLFNKLINALFKEKHSPGIGIKNKAKRCVTLSVLCNIAYLEIGAIEKQQSSEAALQQIQELSEQLANADCKDDIIEIEGKLIALEEKVGVLQPSGLFANFLFPEQVFRDPNSVEEDLSDCNWVIIHKYELSSFLKASYMIEDEESETYYSLYEPTHVINIDPEEKSLEESFDIFTSVDKDSSIEYSQDCLYTKVNYVWDKTTRRIYLYNDSDWTYPLYVWDDPYKLKSFFNIKPLQMLMSPKGGEVKPVTSYYIDHQDNINKLHSVRTRAINNIASTFVYDTRYVDNKEVSNLLNPKSGQAVGITPPLNGSIDSVIKPFNPFADALPFIQTITDAIDRAAIDRIAGISNVARSAEFKTNTTNQAIEIYTSSQTTKLDANIDVIEDWLSEIAYDVLELAVQFLDKQAVTMLVGENLASSWENMDVYEFRQKYQVAIIAGSTEKPTSQAKKQQALQLADMLSRGANNLPATQFVILEILQKAFGNDLVISDENWTLLKTNLQSQLNNNMSAQGQELQPQITQTMENVQ